MLFGLRSNSFRLCNRNFGVGGDGVIFALKAPEGESHSNVFALCDTIITCFTFTDLLIAPCGPQIFNVYRVYQREILTLP